MANFTISKLQRIHDSELGCSKFLFIFLMDKRPDRPKVPLWFKSNVELFEALCLPFPLLL